MNNHEARRRFHLSAVLLMFLGFLVAGNVQAATPNLAKFVDTLPGLGSGAANSAGQYIPIATPTAMLFRGQMTDVYYLTAKEFTQQVHPDLPATHFWGYSDNATGVSKYLGPAIVAERNRPVLLFLTNELPNHELLPVDRTLDAGMGVTNGDVPLNRIAQHLHGGFVPWISDGTPYQWFTPSGQKDESNSLIPVPGSHPTSGTQTFYYPNQQSARLMWYHDHAMGITRTNAYAGIAAPYVLVDNFEKSLVKRGLLPDLVGIPLVIQDKTFIDEATLENDWPGFYSSTGNLWYPHVYDPVDLVPPDSGQPALPLPHPSAVPEFFGDTAMINGAAYPTLTVSPKRVRFRILNGSQARFWHLNLYYESAAEPGTADTARPGPAMYQFGTEGGVLPAVVKHANTTPIPLIGGDPTMAVASGPFNLLLAPAERADLFIDFNRVPAGTSFILYNDAPAPFPTGDAATDYTGTAGGSFGSGPDTRNIMRIVVGPGAGDRASTTSVVTKLNNELRTAFRKHEQPRLLYTGPLPYIGPVNRHLTLNEGGDAYGRLIQKLGTQTLGPLAYMDDPTETPTRGATEVWQITNLTADAHPMHFHLVNLQVIEKNGLPPAPNEQGWKETIRMNPGEVTTVAVKFDLPKLPFPVPTSPRLASLYPGMIVHEYVWHCHILEHEEHDMMRPLVVLENEADQSFSLSADGPSDPSL